MKKKKLTKRHQAQRGGAATGAVIHCVSQLFFGESPFVPDRPEPEPKRPRPGTRRR